MSVSSCCSLESVVVQSVQLTVISQSLSEFLSVVILVAHTLFLNVSENISGYLNLRFISGYYIHFGLSPVRLVVDISD